MLTVVPVFTEPVIEADDPHLEYCRRESDEPSVKESKQDTLMPMRIKLRTERELPRDALLRTEMAKTEPNVIAPMMENPEPMRAYCRTLRADPQEAKSNIDRLILIPTFERTESDDPS
jgi:hypothetical protein